MTSEVEELRRQLAEANARLEAQSGDDSLERALAEFAAQYEQDVPGSLMSGPCQHEDASGVCGLAWKGHHRRHSYRPVPLEHTTREARGYYSGERRPAEPESVVDAYMTEGEARERLGVEDVGLPVETIGGVSLVRRAAVERVIALREMEAADVPDAEDEGLAAAMASAQDDGRHDA